MGDTQEGDDSHAMRTTEQDEVRQLEQQLKDLSCTPYFDGLVYCTTPTNQFKSLYRFGQLDDCAEAIDGLKACMSIKIAKISAYQALTEQIAAYNRVLLTEAEINRVRVTALNNQDLSDTEEELYLAFWRMLLRQAELAFLQYENAIIDEELLLKTEEMLMLVADARVPTRHLLFPCTQARSCIKSEIFKIKMLKCWWEPIPRRIDN